MSEWSINDTITYEKSSYILSFSTIELFGVFILYENLIKYPFEGLEK